MPAYLKLIIGPMFASKTTSLIGSLEKCKYLFKNKEYILFKLNIDNRYSDTTVKTHSDIERACKVVSTADDIYKYSKDYDLIGIDEVQFYPGIEDIIIKMMNEGKSIHVAGLSGDYRQKPFDIISNLIPLATKIIHKKSICVDCFKPAYYTKKKNDNNKLKEIGSYNIYKPVCYKCY